MPPSKDPGALQAFLDHPFRPLGTFRYHELQGFLFPRTIATVLAELDAEGAEPVHSATIGRNDPCPCGSGKKFKKRCGTTVH